MKMSTPLDFSALLSRDFKPARLAQIQPKEDDKSRRLLEQQHHAKRKTAEGDDHHHHHHHHHHHGQNYGHTNKFLQEYVRSENGTDVVVGPVGRASGSSSSSNAAAIGVPVVTSRAASKLKREEETNRLVMQLVSKTPTYRHHLPKRHDENSDDDDDDDDDNEEVEEEEEIEKDVKTLKNYIPIPPPPATVSELQQELPPSFHPVELEDWESKIDWEGYKADTPEPVLPQPVPSSSSAGPTANSSGGGGGNVHGQALDDPMTLLQQRRNPFLDNISFDDLISWTGSPEEMAARAAAVPLILELGVAGRSVAKMALPSQRPESFADSDAYQHRKQLEERAKHAGGGTGAIKTAAEAGRQGKFGDKDAIDKFIDQQQKRRQQLEMDKTKRVRDAMASLGTMGTGRGRAVTSSLMGPGGTERTGRASRHLTGQQGPQEYIEQVDMVANHSLIKDPGHVTLREYHRPKLPHSIVRTTLIWQFCIRFMPSKGKKGAPGTPNARGGGGGGVGDNAASYQAMMMGSQPGAISKAKLRVENDLTPTEGDLVLLEYSEERPPIQLTTGMASKIITYYRGDKSQCPVSAGGGDRPSRRKRPGIEGQLDKKKQGNGDKAEKPPRLVGPNLETTIADWVGKAPKRNKDDRNNEKENINVLPEGVTEVLHPKARGPFIGEIDDGQAVTSLVTNMFVAPIFLQEPESTDFLMILGRNAGSVSAGTRDTLKVVLREMPTSIFTVGQTEPLTKVLAPGTQVEKNFVSPWQSYQIAKFLSHWEMKNGGEGLKFDQFDRVFPNTGLDRNTLRNRLNRVANYDKEAQLWNTKRIGQDDYPGVEAMGRFISPEDVVAWESSLSAVERLKDLGMNQIFSGQHSVPSVAAVMVYLSGQMNTAREFARKLKKLVEAWRTQKNSTPLQIQFVENAAAEMEVISKSLRRKHEVAKFIYEELVLSPWNMTNEFISAGKGDMMRLTGLGDPTGVGEGFNFIREENKPRATAGSAGQTAEMKKITGTEDDLRKLTMKQMGRILLNFGLKESEVKPLKRWDRVHVIRDLSTKSASDGMGDGLERFARGEKKKTKDQKEDYRSRINVIWKRQIAALSASDADGREGVDGNGDHSEADNVARRAAQRQDTAESKDGSDSDDSDDLDDFAAELEDDLLDQKATMTMVANQVADGGGEVQASQLRKAAANKDLSKDARELAAFKRQQEEERVAQAGLSSVKPTAGAGNVSYTDRKVVRQRITKTYPDGRQVTTFKFIVNQQEVGKIMTKLVKEEENKKSKVRPEYMPDEKQVGHSMFEDEDDFEWSARGNKMQGGKKRGGGARRARVGGGARAMPRKRELQVGKLKNKPNKEERIKKRRREEDEMEVYEAIKRRQTTSNRKERGSIRERRPHVIFAKKLESIWAAAENRPSAGAFIKPVDRRTYPAYYERISHPMDLGSIKKRINDFAYPSAEAMLKDFALMMNNTIKFNGSGTVLADEATAMHDMVRDMISRDSAELKHLEEAAAQVMGNNPKKSKGKQKKTKKKGGAGGDSTDDNDEDYLDIDINFDQLSDDSDS